MPKIYPVKFVITTNNQAGFIIYLIDHSIIPYAYVLGTVNYLTFFVEHDRQDIWIYSTASKNSKYFSLLIPMIRMLFLITNVGTSLYFGITTGRIASEK